MWDERYSQPGFAYGTEPNEFLVSVGKRIPPGRVLCLAEGEGRNAVWLAECGYEVVAVDSSAVGLDKARRLAADRGVHIECEVADLARFDLGDQAWQGVVSIFAHLPPALRTDLHARAVRALRPGGAFILEAYTPAQLEHKTGGPPVREMLYELSSLREELDGLEFELARECVREIREGRYHSGPSAVVQVLGWKPS